MEAATCSASTMRINCSSTLEHNTSGQQRTPGSPRGTCSVGLADHNSSADLIHCARSRRNFKEAPSRSKAIMEHFIASQLPWPHSYTKLGNTEELHSVKCQWTRKQTLSKLCMQDQREHAGMHLNTLRRWESYNIKQHGPVVPMALTAPCCYTDPSVQLMLPHYVLSSEFYCSQSSWHY